MIPDGYTWVLKLGAAVCAFRPLLKREAQTLGRLVKACGPMHMLVWAKDRLRHCGNTEGSVEAAMIEVRETPDKGFGKLIGVDNPEVAGAWTVDWEARSAANLEHGLRLMVRNPELYHRSCADCQLHWYRDDGTLVRRTPFSEPLRRPAQAPAPCRTDQGCPKGTPEHPRTLHPINVAAWEHYQRCAATGNFPDDGIVGRNAAIIRKVLTEGRK